MIRRSALCALLAYAEAVPAAHERSARSFHARSFGGGPGVLMPNGAIMLADMAHKAECAKTVPTVQEVEPAWNNFSDGSIDPRGLPQYDHVLLIARYDEHLDWLVDVLEKWEWIKNVLIMNKGPKIRAPLPMDRVRIRDVPNYGREGETLLHFLIQEHDRLPQRIWFLQGEPLTHQPHVTEMFDPQVVRKYNPTFQPLTMQFAEYARIPERLLAAEDTQLDNLVRQLWITASNGGIVFANGVNEDDPLAKAQGVYGFHNILDAMQAEHNVTDRSETIRTVCDMLEIPLPEADSLIPYTMSAMFYVSMEAYQAYPREVYEKIRAWLIYDDETGKAIVETAPGGVGVDTCNYLRQAGRRGYLLERLWQYMFTGEQRPSSLRPTEKMVMWPPADPD